MYYTWPKKIDNKVWRWILLYDPLLWGHQPPRHRSVVFCGFSFIILWTLGLGVVAVHACVCVCWQDNGSAGAACWSQWYLSTSMCSPQGHGNHGCRMISGFVRQRPLSFWTAEAQTGPPTDLWRMVGIPLPLDNMSKWEPSTGLLCFCPSSQTCVTQNLLCCVIENHMWCISEVIRRKTGKLAAISYARFGKVRGAVLILILNLKKPIFVLLHLKWSFLIFLVLQI